MNIIELYEDLRKHINEEKRNEYDDLFYDAPEGEAQVDIVKEIMEIIIAKI